MPHAPDPAPDQAGREGGYPGPRGPERVLLLGKPGCLLCDEAREVVREVADDLGVPWCERSILDDIAWEMTWWEQIPVVFVDGNRYAIWRVDADALRHALTAAPTARSAIGPGEADGLP